MLPVSDSHVRVSAGFVLLILWFAVVNGGELLMIVLNAAAVHELGHWLVLRCFHAEIRRLRVGILGAVLETDCSRLSYGRELAAVLAGPAANLLCASLLSLFGDKTAVAVGAHLVLGAFNLIPLRPLDGGRALHLLVAWWLGPWSADLAVRWTGTVVALCLAGGLCILMHETGGSLWLLPAAVGALAAAGEEWFGTDHFL